MTLHPRTTLSLLAAICLAFSPIPNAHSQATPAAAQPDQSAQSIPQTPATDSSGFGDNTAQGREAYSGFLQLMDFEERTRQLELESGKVQHSSCIDWAQLLRIRQDEEQASRAIAAGAWRQIKENKEQSDADDLALRRSPGKEQSAKYYKHGEEPGTERTEILDETIAKLRQELGEEDLKKLDDYLYRDSPAGMAAAAAKRRANAECAEQSGEDSNTTPSKELQL